MYVTVYRAFGGDELMALDNKGIYLAEIDRKYPKVFQSLGYDVMLDTDSMYKPKVVSTFQLCVNTILTLLFMKPGQYPSIPVLGIDIESYLHEYSDDPNIPIEITTKLNEQCNRLQLTGIKINCYIDKLSDNSTDALVVDVTGTERLSYGSKGSRVLIGITYDKLKRLYTKQIYL